MGGYLANFSVYTFAMIGFLFVAVAIYKKTSVNGLQTSKNGGMEIEESLSLSPRKRLHVVRVNGQKFLIAADLERTEFLAKLDETESISNSGNVIKLNQTPVLVSKPESKVTSILSKVEKFQKAFQSQGNVALKPTQTQYQETKLSHIKNISMKKPPIMKEILRKLEVSQG